ncbi:sodium-independent anion transporter [Thioalkalivibrio denitrificans]|uniref:Sodium-independent anion transporter n=1 Tax=Thioalkalivibrio denitrificans TaxID=108003 RepID=A0A1V3NSR7_9GAMM|nr:SulP family inorganic anion transporter [Thioalkalivibrio denitrificans]OOG28145.1 sodium-independent anion transporter [Thioalkalivibrio denitrificans]
MIKRFLPFLDWFPMRRDNVRADLMAGIAVALVLVPQSMAYAQLAGLPPVYGLYASFLPVLVAALWGSSNQLATGPVAVVSLLTATALIPLAAEGSADYIALAIVLALLVGVIQLSLGLFRMGALVSFISHPVIVGFTNAAAIIIGLSQLNKLFGLPLDTDSAFLINIWNMLLRIGDTHLPTLLMGLGAIAAMWLLKRHFPRLPGILLVVAVSILISWGIGFERKQEIALDAVADADIRELVRDARLYDQRADAIEDAIRSMEQELRAFSGVEALNLRHHIDLTRLEAVETRDRAELLERRLRQVELRAVRGEPGVYYQVGALPEDATPHGPRWRIAGSTEDRLMLDGGGAVVGHVPQGMPSLSMPSFGWNTLTALITSAFIIALVGFTEAIAIAKAMAAKTGQRLDPNKELVGQGLANIVGSVSQAYPVSGSFSRSAVNLTSGARSGLSSVITAMVVLVTLLFLTPLLYHLPQAVLAAIIMMAVIGLVNFKAIHHAWQAHRHDGIAAVVTFIATLAVAPNLDLGIIAGAGLAIVLFLYRRMHPRVSELARYEDGTLRDAQLYGLETTEKYCIMRFDGSLYFANVAYFEDIVLNLAARHPDARYLVIVAKGINEIDASGEEAIRQLARRLRERDMTLVIAGIKAQVLDLMKRTGLYDVIGEKYVFRSTNASIEAVQRWIEEEEGAAGAREAPQAN